MEALEAAKNFFLKKMSTFPFFVPEGLCKAIQAGKEVDEMKERQDVTTLEAIGYVLKGFGILAGRLGEYLIKKEDDGNEYDKQPLSPDMRAEGYGAGAGNDGKGLGEHVRRRRRRSC